jgi:hypothetical protein
MVKLGLIVCVFSTRGKSFHSLDVIAGAGAGLIKGDLADIKEWFRFKKMDFMQKEVSK